MMHILLLRYVAFREIYRHLFRSLLQFGPSTTRSSRGLCIGETALKNEQKTQREPLTRLFQRPVYN